MTAFRLRLLAFLTSANELPSSPDPFMMYGVMDIEKSPAEQGFTSNIPVSALEEEASLVAYEADGEPLTKDHGWPVRLVVPSRYFWKSAKWLRGLQLLDLDEPGFWERYGYNNNADFNKEERYSF